MIQSSDEIMGGRIFKASKGRNVSVIDSTSDTDVGILVAMSRYLCGLTSGNGGLN